MFRFPDHSNLLTQLSQAHVPEKRDNRADFWKLEEGLTMKSAPFLV